MPVREQLIFEYSHPGRGARDQWPHDPGAAALADLPAKLRRARPPEPPSPSDLPLKGEAGPCGPASSLLSTAGRA